MGLINGVSFEAPDSDIAEVTLIGTGGYGESCVVHLGNNSWIVVDSCIEPGSNKSLPLQYLEELNVDVTTQVRLIVCTHWHDDHIKGISELYEKCEAAKFCVADTLDLKKFLYLVKLDYTKHAGKVSNSSTVEFNKCVDLANSRNGAVIKRASKNKVLHTERFDNFISQIISLSPSDFAKGRFDNEISSLINDFGENKKVVASDPNSNSVVILLNIGNHSAILGADLEVKDNDDEGWLNILNKHEEIFEKKSTLFKISHHGSANGYHEKIWADLLEKNAVAGLTPYNRGYGLPEAEMLQVYESHTENLYITSPVISPKKPKKREKQLEKLISFFNSSLREIKFQVGVIRSRTPIEKNEEWQTDLFGNALKVSTPK